MNYRRVQIYFFLTVFTLSLVMSFLVFRPYLGLMVFAGVLAVLHSAEWNRVLREHGAFVEDVEASLMLPAPFSPWR